MGSDVTEFHSGERGDGGKAEPFDLLTWSCLLVNKSRLTTCKPELVMMFVHMKLVMMLVAL